MFQNFKQLPRSYVMGTLIRRREDPEYATEMLNEIGTTDVAIGDVTAEVMITTIGKIPNEMYDLEETSIRSAIAMAEAHHEDALLMDEKSENSSGGFAAHSTLFIILTVALLLLLLLCCVAACVIARARKRFLDASDMECDAECSGAKQPLISSDKLSETTSKSSVTSRN